MTGVIYIPSANAADDLTGAVLDSDATTGTTSTRLTNGTEYRPYALSSSGAAFTPMASTNTVPVSVAKRSTNTGTSGQSVTHANVPLGATDPNRKLYVAVSLFRVGGVGLSTLAMTVGGQSCTRLVAQSTADNVSISAIFAVNTDPGGTEQDIVVSIGPSEGVIATGRTFVEVLRGVRAGGWTAGATSQARGTQNLSLNTNVSNGNVVLGHAFVSTSGEVLSPSFTGLTLQGTPPDWESGEYSYTGIHECTATETPRTITAQCGTATFSRHVGVAVVLS